MPARRSAGNTNPAPFRRAALNRLIAVLFLGAALLGAGCTGRPSPTQPDGGQMPTAVQSSPEAPPVTVYFSDPLARKTTGGLETPLVEAIDSAQVSIDMAIYNLSLENVASALISAHQRGVEVRLVMESEALERKQPQRLAQAGIPIVGDQREGLMHNKFTVIDGKEVWTGSMNYTTTSAYSDYNDLVHIASGPAAQNYAVEFAEMFDERLFGPDRRPATPYPLVDLGISEAEFYFSPDDGVAKQIVSEIRAAQESIDIMAYALTNDSITAALLERAAAGVRVRGVFDADQARSNTGGDTGLLRERGIPVREDGISGLMHHKAIILDGATVITGSFNFTANADRSNDENVVILHDAGIAALYSMRFKTIYESGK